MKSHSSTNVTAGISRCARVRCSAICRRTPRSGSRRPSEACVAVRHKLPVRAAPRTSSSVIRPFGPVPLNEPDRRRAPARGGARAASPAARVVLIATLVSAGAARLGLRLGGRVGCRLGAVAADHDEHGADGDDLALGDEDPRHLAGGRARGSRRSSCRSGSRRAGRPRRPPGPRPRASGRSRPRSAPRRGPAA